MGVVRAAVAAVEMGMGPCVVEQQGTDQGFWGGVVLWLRESLGDGRATGGGANVGSGSKAAGNGKTASDSDETRGSGMAHDEPIPLPILPSRSWGTGSSPAQLSFDRVAGLHDFICG